MNPRNRRVPSRSRLRRGAVMMEFAIVLPIFLLAMIGIIEFGRAIMVHQILVNAAREGARRAIIPETTNSDVTELIIGDGTPDKPGYLVQAGLGAPSRQIAITDENGNAVDLATVNSHTVVAVVVSVPYNEVGVGISTYFTNTTMAARVQMHRVRA